MIRRIIPTRRFTMWFFSALTVLLVVGWIVSLFQLVPLFSPPQHGVMFDSGLMVHLYHGMLNVFYSEDSYWDKRTHFRKRMLTTLRALLKAGEWDVFVDWMRFPDDLPDRRLLRPKGNSQPEGLNRTWFAERQAANLPQYY